MENKSMAVFLGHPVVHTRATYCVNIFLKNLNRRLKKTKNKKLRQQKTGKSSHFRKLFTYTLIIYCTLSIKYIRHSMEDVPENKSVSESVIV